MSEIVRLPRLLNADMSEKARPVPSKLPMTIETYGVSTAQMTLGEDQPDVKLHDIFELFTIDGSVGLFRATNTAWTVRNSRVITLRHCRDTFADSVWKRPDGTNLDYSGTVPDFLAEIISRQVIPYWQLGVCEDTSAWKKSGIYYTRLSDLLDELEKKRKDYIFAYDFSTTPWTLNYVHVPGDIAEFRLSRNVTGCKISYDDESLCNKLYMTWSVNTEDGRVKSILTFENSASQAVYGVIEKTVDVKESDEPSAEAWAADYLATHGDPSVQISIDGGNFYALTGVALDNASRGKIARVALPDYGVTVMERVISIKYADALNEPHTITADLSNNSENVASTLAQIQKTASSGASAASEAGEEAAAEGRRARYSEGGLSAEISETASEIRSELYSADSNMRSVISQTASEIRTELWAADSKLSSTISQTATEIRTEVSNAESGLYSAISQTASEIRTEVASTESGLRSTISQTASEIRSEVASADSSIWSSVTANASSITSKVGKGEVISMINQTAETITISANRIDLSGYVTASELSATNANFSNLTSGTTKATAIKATLLQCDTFNIDNTNYAPRTLKMGSTVSATVLSSANAAIDFDHSHEIEADADASGNVTITIKKTQVSNGSDSFSIADTTFHKNAVSAAKDTGLKSATVSIGSWGTYDSAYKVPVYATGTLQNGTTWTSTASYVSLPSLSISAGNYNSSSKSYPVTINSGNTAVGSGTLYATSAYNAGWGDAAGEVSAPAYGTGSTMSVGVPSSTVGSASSMTFTLSCYTNYAYITYGGSNGTVVARVANPVTPASLTTGSATSNGTYTPGSGYDGFSSFTVNVPSTSYSSSDLHISKDSSGRVYLYLTGGSPSRSCTIAVRSITRYSSSQYYVTVRIDGDTDFNLSYSGSIS